MLYGHKLRNAVYTMYTATSTRFTRPTPPSFYIYAQKYADCNLTVPSFSPAYQSCEYLEWYNLFALHIQSVQRFERTKKKKKVCHGWECMMWKRTNGTGQKKMQGSQTNDKGMNGMGLLSVHGLSENDYKCELTEWASECGKWRAKCQEYKCAREVLLKCVISSWSIVLSIA